MKTITISLLMGTMESQLCNVSIFRRAKVNQGIRTSIHIIKWNCGLCVVTGILAFHYTEFCMQALIKKQGLYWPKHSWK
ncbi:hypothetical protein ACHAXS_003459 [Conticribra weissflogii]